MSLFYTFAEVYTRFGIAWKAADLAFLRGTVLEVTFMDGTAKLYDVAALYDKYPQFRALENRSLFLSGRLAGSYGIIWNEDLDLEVETVYEDGVIVSQDGVIVSQDGVIPPPR